MDVNTSRVTKLRDMLELRDEVRILAEGGWRALFILAFSTFAAVDSYVDAL